MNIKTKLLTEHSKENTLQIVNYIGHNPDRFGELMDLFFEDENRVAQRASWVMSQCTKEYPTLIIPYLEVMVDNLYNNVHNAVKRNTVRIFQDIDIPESLIGKLADVCFKYLEDTKEAVAVRIFSMTVLYRICLREPELKNDLQLLIEEFLPHGTAGFKSRGKKILKQLAKM